MSEPHTSHDAQRAIADLRDHLVRHDRPIAFLFGAGTSCSIRVPAVNGAATLVPFIPAVNELTAICRSEVEALGDEYSKAWSSIEALCAEKRIAPNVESVLSSLRMMILAIGGADKLAGLDRAGLLKVEAAIRKTIARVVSPDLGLLPPAYPHRSFAKWIARTTRVTPIEIFTVNYDVLLEHALEWERVNVFDGFVGSYRPYFSAESLRRQDSAPGPGWTRLWKLHGSVTWHKESYDGHDRIVRGDVNPEGEMILPSFQKYDESRQQPYSAFLERLGRFLELEDALLIASGFNFGDEHINSVLFSALENRPRTHAIALQYEEIPEGSDLATRSRHRPNLMVLGPESGTLRGERAPWRPDEPPAFMATFFEVETCQDPTGERSIGKLKLGDFGAFSAFLESLLPG